MSFSEVRAALWSASLSTDSFLLQDRMLVRVCKTDAENLSAHFDESTHRVTRDLEFQDWTEFLVAWRRDYIEIYEDHVSFNF